MLFHELLHLLFGHFIFVQVAHVSDKHYLTVGLFVLVDLLHPEVVQLSQGKFVVDLVYQDDCVRAAVVRRNNRPEILRPSSIPNLHLNSSPINIKRLKLKINPNGRYSVGRKYIIHKPQQQTTLPHP
jgi:hypothetical protein